MIMMNKSLVKKGVKTDTKIQKENHSDLTVYKQLLFKERICSHREQILSFNSSPILEKGFSYQQNRYAVKIITRLKFGAPQWEACIVKG